MLHPGWKIVIFLVIYQLIGADRQRPPGAVAGGEKRTCTPGIKVVRGGKVMVPVV